MNRNHSEKKQRKRRMTIEKIRSDYPNLNDVKKKEIEKDDRKKSQRKGEERQKGKPGIFKRMTNFMNFVT